MPARVSGYTEIQTEIRVHQMKTIYFQNELNFSLTLKSIIVMIKVVILFFSIINICLNINV